MSDAETSAAEGGGAPTSRGPIDRLDARLAALRGNDRYRRVALGLAVVVGIGLVWLHWLGLVLAGALVGLTRRSLPRALLAAFGFGLLVLAVLLVTAEAASVDALGTLKPLSYLTVALALLAPTWGALLRGAL